MSKSEEFRKTSLYLQRLNENIMQNVEQNTPLANNHISVDCVVIGFDGEQLKVLLVKRAGEEEGEVFHDMKLPGSLIYMDEDLDEAAQRVLNELTGLKNVNLMQFKAFGSKNRISSFYPILPVCALPKKPYLPRKWHAKHSERTG
jgi:ADP-ribose pyrophosphatase YjhB (NUDIX family)